MNQKTNLEKISELEQLKIYNIVLQCPDDNNVKINMLDICIEENEKLTISFYLDKKDYYQSDNSLQQSMSNYVFDLFDKHQIDSDSLVPFIEFVYCDNENESYSYDFRFHIKDEKKVLRKKGLFYSESPKLMLKRINEREKMLIEINREISKITSYDLICEYETSLIKKYQTFVLAIDKEDRICFQDSLENFFRDFLDIDIESLDSYKIEKIFPDLFKYAKQNFQDINIFMLFSETDYDPDFLLSRYDEFVKELSSYLDEKDVLDLLNMMKTCGFQSSDTIDIVDAYKNNTL